MKLASQESIAIGDRRVEYRRIPSKRARYLRVRVGATGVEVVQPMARKASEVTQFLRTNGDWVITQLDRVERLGGVRLPSRHTAGEILWHGEPTRLVVESDSNRRGANRVRLSDAGIVVVCGSRGVDPAKTLENWLRQQARAEIDKQLAKVSARLKQTHGKVFVMGQRTKWGNCSAKRNLSFNWRLILAPPFVLRYMVTHEAVHLAVPDHSAKFWLTVRSLCQETERARQWLTRNSDAVFVDLATVCGS